MSNTGRAGIAMRDAADRMPVDALVAASDRVEAVRDMLADALRSGPSRVGTPAEPRRP